MGLIHWEKEKAQGWHCQLDNAWMVQGCQVHWRRHTQTWKGTPVQLITLFTHASTAHIVGSGWILKVMWQGYDPIHLGREALLGTPSCHARTSMYCILTFIAFSQQLLHFSCFLNITSTTSHKQLLAWYFLIGRLFTVFLHFYQLCLDFISSHSGFNLQLDQILPDPILLGRFFLIRILVADIFKVKFWLISSILQKYVWSWHTAMPSAMLTNIKYIQPCQLRSFQNGWKLSLLKQQQSLGTWWYLPAVECGKTV